MPFGVKIMEVGKIVVAGLAAMGAVVLGQGIEAALLAIPGAGAFLAFEIPLLGSIASLLGIFLGAVISGILGAVVINWIQKRIEAKLKGMNLENQVKAGNEVVAIKGAQEVLAHGKGEIVKAIVAGRIQDRHNSLDEKVASIEHQRMVDESINPDEISNAETEEDGSLSRLRDANKGLDDLLDG